MRWAPMCGDLGDTPAPARAKPKAMERPMPRLPPATTARRPSKLKAIFCISLLRDACPDSSPGQYVRPRMRLRIGRSFGLQQQPLRSGYLAERAGAYQGPTRTDPRRRSKRTQTAFAAAPICGHDRGPQLLSGAVTPLPLSPGISRPKKGPASRPLRGAVAAGLRLRE